MEDHSTEGGTDPGGTPRRGSPAADLGQGPPEREGFLRRLARFGLGENRKTLLRQPGESE